MKRLAKILAIVAAVVVVLIVVALFVAYMAFGSIVKKGVEAMGPRVLGAPVKLEAMDFSLFRGSLDLRGLVVGNPEGFNTESAFRLGRVHVKLVPSSVLGKTIHIQEVLVDSPEVTYEMSLKGSNIGAIKKNVEAFTGGGAPASETPKPPAPKEEKAAGPGKKVMIDDFRFTGGKVNLSATFLKGQKAGIPLPEIHLTDIGKDSGGKSIGETVADITKAVTDAIGRAASGAAKGLAGGGGQVADQAKAAGKAAKETASGAVKSLKGLFKRK